MGLLKKFGVLKPPEEKEKAQAAANQKYKETEPQELGSGATEIPLQTIFYPKAVPLSEMTTDQLFLGGSNVFEVLVNVIGEMQKLQSRITMMNEHLAALERKLEKKDGKRKKKSTGTQGN